MINPDLKSNVLGNVETGIPLCHNQSTAVNKKIALKDVQNNNKGFVRNYQGTSADVAKVSGSKRQTPGGSVNTRQSLISKGVNDHLADVRKRFEAELGKSRHDNWDKKTKVLPSRPNANNNMKQDLPQQTQIKDNAVSPPASGIIFPKVVPLWKNNTVESNGIKVKTEVFPVLTEAANNKWRERFVALQNFLKQCDESASQRDYAQKMLLLSPSDLSKHAVGLETRAIQLTIEEGKEMQRVKVLNILGKAGPTNNSNKTCVTATNDPR
ncbi:uncharacterized protein LOC124931287 [Impatiens glandulifera]|uniref:uncharacterized protein LOC124931287 n=1 Tax=Impatiens glandulifera TaxID=253017 RepID=UPI001FB07B02|nr:uncharacterized protein LOC124931287 [Impatiens glandulifera]